MGYKLLGARRTISPFNVLQLVPFLRAARLKLN
jgi:hypothetical protein